MAKLDREIVTNVRISILIPVKTELRLEGPNADKTLTLVGDVKMKDATKFAHRVAKLCAKEGYTVEIEMEDSENDRQ